MGWMKDACVEIGTLDAEDVADLVVTDEVGVIVQEATRCHATLCRRLGLTT